MNDTDEKLRDLLRLVLSTEANEIDCDDFLTRVAACLESLGPHDGIPPEFHAVAQHLDVCGECREEYEALLEIFRARTE